MRTKQHYLDMFERNPQASIGVNLVADAVYVARYGPTIGNDANHHYTPEWRAIAYDLRARFGEQLSSADARAEIGQK